LLQESLSVAYKTGALATTDLERVVVDTTVQPKAITHPSDARLCHQALEKLVDLAQRNQVPLRQSYRRVAKRAAIMAGRYTHAHQFKRARRALKFLRIRLGRVIRDIRRKIAGDDALKERFADLLALAHRVRFQDHRQRGRKVYSLHVRSSASARARRGRPTSSAARCRSRPRRPSPRAASSFSTPRPCAAIRSTATRWAGHHRLEELTGVETRRIHVDKGYRGHNHKEKFRLWITGQVRRVTRPIRREMKQRAAVKPVIGHVKAEHRMGRSPLRVPAPRPDVDETPAPEDDARRAAGHKATGARRFYAAACEILHKSSRRVCDIRLAEHQLSYRFYR
jgi:IS5 family transposase